MQSPDSFVFNNDGTKMFIIDFSDKLVNCYKLSDAFDLSSTITYVNNFSFEVVTGQRPISIAFSNDGYKMFIASYGEKIIRVYNLLNPFNLENVVYDEENTLEFNENQHIEDITFNNDGTKMFIINFNSDNTEGYLGEYSLIKRFDLSTAVYQHKITVNEQ